MHVVRGRSCNASVEIHPTGVMLEDCFEAKLKYQVPVVNEFGVGHRALIQRRSGSWADSWVTHTSSRCARHLGRKVVKTF